MGGLNIFNFVYNKPIEYFDTKGLKGNTNCKCGPDVTEWYTKEFYYHRKYMESYRTHYGVNLFAFRQHAKYLMAYKWMNFNMKGCATGDCANTVSLCGICVRKNQLGNIMFSYIAAGIFRYDSAEKRARKINDVRMAPRNGEMVERKDNLIAFAMGNYIATSNETSLCNIIKKFMTNSNAINRFSYLYTSDKKANCLKAEDLTITPREGFNTTTCKPCGKSYPKSNINSVQYLVELIKKHGFTEGDLFKFPFKNEDKLDKILDQFKDFGYRGPDSSPGGHFNPNYLKGKNE